VHWTASKFRTDPPALTFIACNGPASDEDRWEEDAGVNAFTVAVCVSALVCGASFLDEPARTFALELADYWNARIEDWTSVCETALSRLLDVAGYYVRIAPPLAPTARAALSVSCRSRTVLATLPAREAQVSTDFLQLVRLGLRDPHDRWW